MPAKQQVYAFFANLTYFYSSTMIQLIQFYNCRLNLFFKTWITFQTISTHFVHTKYKMLFQDVTRFSTNKVHTASASPPRLKENVLTCWCFFCAFRTKYEIQFLTTWSVPSRRLDMKATRSAENRSKWYWLMQSKMTTDVDVLSFVGGNLDTQNFGQTQEEAILFWNTF